jgi:phenylalanyl-tRNA synthetase beta chain
MKLSINWLREYVDFDCSLHELAHALTMAGLEVEESRELLRSELVALGGEGVADDVVFDVKVTPNRGDWLSVLGVAREVGALLDTSFRSPAPEVAVISPEASDLIRIRIEATDLCRRYVGVVIRNVTIGESPGWMKDRLIAAGMRPINNVVDVTNYVMLELGQPLHAFDYRLIRGPEIIVRRARAGEMITSLDGIHRELHKDMLVIADSERAVAIAGIMGGVDSEISKQTQDILIESANFNNVGVRRTSKRLNMVTESSYRFERGVDPSITAVAARRATELVQDLAGGEVASGIVDVYHDPVGAMEVTVRPERANLVLGASIDPDEMASYLRRLGIGTRPRNGVLICNVPSYRPDVTREIDLIEEIGRIYGYDNIDVTLPSGASQGKDSPEGSFRERLRVILMSCGAQEVLTHSLVPSRFAEVAGLGAECVRMRNPLSEELDAMRAALTPNLLQVVARNQAFGTTNANVFEIGKIYRQTQNGIDERLSIAGAMVGSLWRSAWGLPEKGLDVDFFACKGLVESLLSALGISGVRFVEVQDEPMLHATRGAKIMVGDTSLGFFGEASPAAREALDVRGRPCVYELDFGSLMAATPELLSYTELPRYPALYRHVAVVVADGIRFGDVKQVVLESGQGKVEEVDLLDDYRGEQVGSGRRSLTVSMVFRSRERTLTDEEVNAVLEGIKGALQTRLAASFR